MYSGALPCPPPIPVNSGSVEQKSVPYDYPSQLPLYGEVEPSHEIGMEINAAMTSLSGPAIEDYEQSDPHYQRVPYRNQTMRAVPVTHHNVTPSVLPVYSSYSDPARVTKGTKEMPLSLLTRALSSLGNVIKRRSRDSKSESEPHVDFYKLPTASSYIPSGYETYSIGESTTYPPPVYPGNAIVADQSPVYLQSTPPPGMTPATRHPV